MSRYPCICENFFQNFSREKKLGALGGGGGGLQQSSRPEREDLAAKINNFRSFHFLIFSFCHNNVYVPETL